MTASGCEIMTTWEPSTSEMVAPARSAIDRTASVPIARSFVPTTAQVVSRFQAGAPVFS